MVDFCPHLRFYRCIARSYVEQFRRAESKLDRNRALDGALTVAKMAVQVIAPLAEKQGPQIKGEYLAIADSLFALARVSDRDESWAVHPGNFPVDDRQILIAKIEQCAEKIEELKREMKRQTSFCAANNCGGAA